MTVRKPTEQKKLEGTYRADRAAKNEPQPIVSMPECPEWITGEGRKEYDRIAGILVSTRVLTVADWSALAAYAHEFDCWVRAARRVEHEGSVLTSSKGGKYINPRVGIEAMHFKNMVKLMTELGLTPASRSRIEAQPEDDKPMSLAEKLFQGVSQVES